MAKKAVMYWCVVKNEFEIRMGPRGKGRVLKKWKKNESFVSAFRREKQILARQNIELRAGIIPRLGFPRVLVVAPLGCTWWWSVSPF